MHQRYTSALTVVEALRSLVYMQVTEVFHHAPPWGPHKELSRPSHPCFRVLDAVLRATDKIVSVLDAG